METILTAPEAIDTLCRGIIAHYEDSRENLLTGKTPVAAYSRPIAMDIYYKMIEMGLEWKEKPK